MVKHIEMQMYKNAPFQKKKLKSIFWKTSNSQTQLTTPKHDLHIDVNKSHSIAHIVIRPDQKWKVDFWQKVSNSLKCDIKRLSKNQTPNHLISTQMLKMHLDTPNTVYYYIYIHLALWNNGQTY